MKILIIGGTGNISTAITRMLTTKGASITLFKRKAEVPNEFKSMHVIAGDRTNSSEFKEKLSGIGSWDCVIDMVCYEPEDAQAAVEVFRGQTKQLIFCSTVDVYNKIQPNYPVSEDTGVMGALPSFPYALSKLKCEEIFGAAHSRGDFALTVFRPAFTYNESWSPGIHCFGGQSYHLDRLRKGKPIILHGDGTTISVATYRDDVAAPFVNAVGNSIAYGAAYNVTGDEWMTQNYIWTTIARLLDAPSPRFVYIPTDLLARLVPVEASMCMENFRHNNIFDNSKAKCELGFRYSVTFEQGARKCIDYLLRHLAIESSDNYPFYDRILEGWNRYSSEMVQQFRGRSL